MLRKLKDNQKLYQLRSKNIFSTLQNFHQRYVGKRKAFIFFKFASWHNYYSFIEDFFRHHAWQIVLDKIYGALESGFDSLKITPEPRSTRALRHFVFQLSYIQHKQNSDVSIIRSQVADDQPKVGVMNQPKKLVKKNDNQKQSTLQQIQKDWIRKSKMKKGLNKKENYQISQKSQQSDNLVSGKHQSGKKQGKNKQKTQNSQQLQEQSGKSNQSDFQQQNKRKLRRKKSLKSKNRRIDLQQQENSETQQEIQSQSRSNRRVSKNKRRKHQHVAQQISSQYALLKINGKNTLVKICNQVQSRNSYFYGARYEDSQNQSQQKMQQSQSQYNQCQQRQVYRKQKNAQARQRQFATNNKKARQQDQQVEYRRNSIKRSKDNEQFVESRAYSKKKYADSQIIEQQSQYLHYNNYFHENKRKRSVKQQPYYKLKNVNITSTRQPFKRSVNKKNTAQLKQFAHFASLKRKQQQENAFDRTRPKKKSFKKSNTEEFQVAANNTGHRKIRHNDYSGQHRKQLSEENSQFQTTNAKRQIESQMLGTTDKFKTKASVPLARKETIARKQAINRRKKHEARIMNETDSDSGMVQTIQLRNKQYLNSECESLDGSIKRSINVTEFGEYCSGTRRGKQIISNILEVLSQDQTFIAPKRQKLNKTQPHTIAKILVRPNFDDQIQNQGITFITKSRRQTYRLARVAGPSPSIYVLAFNQTNLKLAGTILASVDFKRTFNQASVQNRELDIQSAQIISNKLLAQSKLPIQKQHMPSPRPADVMPCEPLSKRMHVTCVHRAKSSSLLRNHPHVQSFTLQKRVQPKKTVTKHFGHIFQAAVPRRGLLQ